MALWKYWPSAEAKGSEALCDEMCVSDAGLEKECTLLLETKVSCSRQLEQPFITLLDPARQAWEPQSKSTGAACN
jgi:hypothetical protein